MLLVYLGCGRKCSMWLQVALVKLNGNKFPKISCPSTLLAFKTHPNVFFTSLLTIVRWIRFSMFDSSNQVSKEQKNTNFWQTINHLFTCASHFRNSHRTSIRMFRLLERPDDKWHLGLELHITHWCQAVQRMLCKYIDNIFLSSSSSFSFEQKKSSQNFLAWQQKENFLAKFIFLK